MISIENITVLRSEVKVIQNYSASIQPAQSTLLSGPNGAGKTTLIHAIAGSLGITAGSIEIDGQSPYSTPPLELSKLRSVAPQRRIFTLAFNVAQLLDFIPINERIHNWQEVLEQLGLNSLFNQRVTELSVGQQQRVSLGLALLQESKYYLIDEPFSAQDSEFQKRILLLLTEIAKEKGVLVVSHNTDLLHSYFDQELIIS